MKSYTFCLCWIVVLTLASLSYGQEKVTLKLALQPGQSWTFDQTQDSSSDNTASANGQSQQFTVKSHSRRLGKIEVVAVKDGEPTSLKISFDEGCETSAQSGGQQQQVPFVYAGKTVTITRGDDGSVTEDFTGQADPAAVSELHTMMEQEQSLFPKNAVGVGEEWPADAPALSRVLQLQGNDQAGATMKLLSVKVIDGRPTAEVKVSLALVKNQQGIVAKVISQGTTLIDIRTGHSLSLDAKGTTTITGDQTAPGGQGQFHVEGNGTLNTSMASKFISVGDSGGLSPPPPVDQTANAGGGGAVNPLSPDAPADAFAGQFSDGKLTIDLSTAADGYSGTITLGAKKYPVTAHHNGQRIEGTFDTGGNKFPISATVSGDTMMLTSGQKSYTLKKAAANPLDAPAAPANPLDQGSSAEPSRGGSSDALAAYTVVNKTADGRALSIEKPGVTSVKDAFAATFPDLEKYFDSRPDISGAYEDVKDHRSGTASFTAKLKGQAVTGLVSCKLGEKGATVAVIYCQANAPRDEWAKLTAVAADKGATAAPEVQLRTYQFPDGTGAIGLAPGWSTNAQSCANTVELNGPNDEKVVLGFVISVVTPDSTPVQLQRQLEANARQMGLSPPPPMQLFVAPYSAPADALKVLLPQISQASQRNGGPALTLDKILSVQPQKSQLPGGQAALISYTAVKTEQHKSSRYKALSQIETAPLVQGSWLFYAVEGNGPESIFDRDLPAMIAMCKSLSVNQQQLAQVTRQHIDAQNQAFAAMQQARQQQEDGFEDYLHHIQHNETIASRSFADFDETIVGSRDVLDTATGEKTSVDLGNVNAIVDRLNQNDPGRYQQIPLRDELYPLSADNK